MDFRMRDLNQQIIKFQYDQNFRDEDFYVSKSNKHIFDFIKKWPKWEKNLLNISGPKFSGKTHLINIFIKNFDGYKLETNLINNEFIKEVKLHKNIILENLNNEIDEKLLYTLINLIEVSNKFLIITSIKPIVEMQFNLIDLKSRFKNFLLQSIEKPDDELMFALILKFLSDRQILLDKKLINYIIKRVDRSYEKIFDFIFKIDEASLKKKKSIDFEIIKDVLEEY